MDKKFYRTTVNTEEIHQFGKFAHQWWDENGPFKPLHQLNPVRIDFIRTALENHFSCTSEDLPLKGLSILDIGCGGGLVTECLARLGATVTGIDASPQTIDIAQQHAEERGLEISYRIASVEDMVGQTFDAVLALEVVEHVDHVAFFLAQCTKLLKSNGLFILSTLNRTWKSWALAIVGAEYILRWLPRGTHQWEKFLKPSELSEMLRSVDFTPQAIQGMSFHPLDQSWSLTDDLDVNYLMSFSTMSNHS